MMRGLGVHPMLQMLALVFIPHLEVKPRHHRQHLGRKRVLRLCNDGGCSKKTREELQNAVRRSARGSKREDAGIGQRVRESRNEVKKAA